MNYKPHRLLTFDVIARCLILATASTTCSLGWFVPFSLTAKLIQDGGAYGQIALLLLTACVVIGWIDIFINDVLPASVFFEAIRSRRNNLYHFLAGVYLIEAYVGVGKSFGIEDFLPISYAMNGILAAWYSWTVTVRATNV